MTTELETSDMPLSDSYLEQLVGEGKKYNSVEQLAKAYANADVFIEALKSQNNDLKSEVEKRMAIEEFIKSNQQDKTEVSLDTTADPEGGKQVSTQTSQTERSSETKVDESELIERIKEELRKDNENEVFRKNTEEVGAKLRQIFGDNVEAINSAMAEKAAEIGVSVQWLKDTAAKSPKAFFNITGLDSSKTTPPPPSPKPALNVSSPSLTSSQPQPGTKAWYDSLRKENLKEFLKPDVQLKYMSDAMKDPDKFFGNTN